MALAAQNKRYLSSKRFILISAFALAVLTITVATAVNRLSSLGAHPLSSTLDITSLPLAFEINQGQAGEEVNFLTRGFGGYLQFIDQGLSWYFPESWQERSLLSPNRGLQFQDTEAAPKIHGGKSLPGVINYLIGDDPALWHTNIPTYEDLVYEQLYPGINLSYTGQRTNDGHWSLKSTYLVAPGANPNRIRWRYTGATGIRLDGTTGDLLISLSDSGNRTLTEKAPISWQVIGEKQVPVEINYELLDEDDSIRFMVGSYDSTEPLYIDPTLVFSTFLGTDTEEDARAIVLNKDGSIIVAGSTESVNFPVTPDAFQSSSTGGICVSPPPFNYPFPCSDGFIAKLSADGSSLLYSTYLGGTRDDGIRAIALDNDGNIYLTGWTTSIDFPTLNPIQPTNGGGSNFTPDSFAVRLTADGTDLQYGTYIGGGARDYGDNIAVDKHGNAYVTGWTESTDFPTVNPAQAAYGGGFFDGVITKINADGDAFDYSSYIGGNDLEYIFGVDVDQAGSAYLTGFTLSDDFPTVNAMQPTFGGGIEAYVTKLTVSGNSYEYSTYFGADDTRGFDIRVNESGYAYLVGVTSSPNFPTVSPLQADYSGAPYDAFVSRFLPDGSALDFSTYLGGDGHDVIHTLALDDSQNVHFVGWSSSTNFPLSSPVQAVPGGSTDLITGRIKSDLSALDFSTYLGGSQSDLGFAIALGGSSQVHVAGYSSSADFPTTLGVYDAEFNGGDLDAIVAKIDLEQPDIPRANFVSSSPDVLGETTVFTNTSTGGNLSYLWDFGDSSPVVTTTHPVHIYPAAGQYSTTLTVTNPLGESIATATVEITEESFYSFLPWMIHKP